jgi:hypothetical protein
VRALLFAMKSPRVVGLGVALGVALAIFGVTRRGAAEGPVASDAPDAPAVLVAPAAATRARAEAIFSQAERDDDALDFADALARSAEARALHPGSPNTPRAEARATALRTHAEGSFAPLAKLERVRRDPARSSDPRAVEDLVHEAESFPPGLVRVEVWVLAAEAYAYRFGRPLDAEPLLERVLADPLADVVVARKAARDLVTLRLGRGDLTGAEDAVRKAGPRADPQLARDVRRAARRRSVHLASIALLVAMAILAARAVIVAMRRRAAGAAGAPVRAALATTWKLALAYSVYVAVFGALLASGYEAGTTRPFLYFGLVLLPIVLLARAWAAAGGGSVAARGGRAALCALSVAAAAFLVLEGVDVSFLDGMGL